MNRSVFLSFHPIIIRKICADLANATCYCTPTLLAGGLLSLQATSTRQLNYDLDDVFREIANPPEI